MTRITKTILAVIIALVVLVAVLVVINRPTLHGSNETLTPQSELTAKKLPKIIWTHKRTVTVSPGRGAYAQRDEKYTMTATSALTHQDLFRYWQTAHWSFASPGIKFNPNSKPYFTRGHWVNNALDNAWSFDTYFPPELSHGCCYPSTSVLPYYRQRSSARFKLCVFRVGCVRNMEVWIMQRVEPALGNWGYQASGGQ